MRKLVQIQVYPIVRSVILAEAKRAEEKKEKDKPEIIHISEFQDRCEQYGNNDDACYAPGPHQYKPCCAEHCPYCKVATDEDFMERNLNPSRNDGNYVIPFYDPSLNES